MLGTGILKNKIHIADVERASRSKDTINPILANVWADQTRISREPSKHVGRDIANIFGRFYPMILDSLPSI